MVICLEQGADLHTAQLMPLSLTVSCFSKIQIGFTFLVPVHPGSPVKMAVKRVCVCVVLDLNAGQLTRQIYSGLMQWTNGPYEESWTFTDTTLSVACLSFLCYPLGPY